LLSQCCRAAYIRSLPFERLVLVFTHHGTCYPATLHDGKLDVNSLEQMLAFDSLLNALNGTSPECDGSGLSCTVFGGDIKTQTQFRTGTPGACGVTFAIQELDCELVSIQHILILQELYCCFSFLSFFLFGPTCLYMYIPHMCLTRMYLSLTMQVRGLWKYASAMNWKQQMGRGWW